MRTILARCTLWPRGRFKLRAVLVFPFVLQITLSVGLVGYLSYRSGQSSVYILADQLAESISNGIESSLRTYFAVPQALNIQHENEFAREEYFS